MSLPVRADAHESQLSVAAAQGLRWLLEDLLDAEQDLLALLTKPASVPVEQRERLLMIPYPWGADDFITLRLGSA